jgi:hypothetical protein
MTFVSLLLLLVVIVVGAFGQDVTDMVSSPPSSASSSSISSSEECASIKSIRCYPIDATTTPLFLDGYADDWPSTIESFVAHMTSARPPHVPYPRGDTVTVRCAHDDTRLYFLFEVPGMYRRSDDGDDRKNAAMSTMFRIGELATLVDMVSSFDTYAFPLGI